jgi:GDP-L-fucose synthase
LEINKTLIEPKMSAKHKVFLTGGSVLVGRNILEHPAADQFLFLAPTSAELDLRDFARVEDYVSTYSPDFVIHAAGLVGGIQANMARPVDFLVENLDLGRNVILASRNAGVMKLLNL